MTYKKLILSLIMFINSYTFAAKTIKHKIPLGDDFAFIEIYESDKKGPVFFHPHEDEKTSYIQSKKIIDAFGGNLVSVKQDGNRLLKFVYKKEQYVFDPNRMFTLDGIRNTLVKYSSVSDEAVQIVDNFANRIANMVIGNLVIAVHNNYDKGYNINSYKNDSKEVKFFYKNPQQGTGEFFYTTDNDFFNFAKTAGYNVVLQSNGVINDGSFSVYAGKKGVNYVNLEVKRGEKFLENKMLLFLVRYFSNKYPNKKIRSWQSLKKGDTIDLIAPSSATNPENVKKTIALLESFGFKVSTRYAKSEPTPLWYDNTDEYRSNAFFNAMNNSNSQAVWAIKGGAGATRLLPSLLKYEAPKKVKPLIGFSDITGLHNFVNNVWNFSSLHALVADYGEEIDKEINSKINDEEKIKKVIDILLTKDNKQIKYEGLVAMNDEAKKVDTINGNLLGGNLTLIQSTLDTPFQPDMEGSFLILEDIGNSAHQLERILDNIRYSNLLNGVKAVIMGEFIQTTNDNNAVTNMINLVLERFAKGVNVPVFRGNFFGHSKINHPIPLATKAKIKVSGDGFYLEALIK